MPNYDGSPTFEEMFGGQNFAQLRQGLSQLLPLLQQQYPQQTSFTEALRAPAPPGITTEDRQRYFLQALSAGANDLARIYQGQAPVGGAANALGEFSQLARSKEMGQQQTELFNVGQQNQFGRGALQNQMRLAQIQQQGQERMAQIAAQQASIDTREDARLAEQKRMSQATIDAANQRQTASIQAQKDLEVMREKAAVTKTAATAAAKPPTEAAVKEATTIASLADSLKSAESAFNATIKAHPSRMGQLVAGASSEFLPKALGHNVGQGLASSFTPEAQFAEGQLNALSAVIDKLRTGNSRFAIQLYNALRPLVPTVGLTPENAKKKFEMLRRNLNSVMMTRLKLAPNQAPALDSILRAVQEDMGQPGQPPPQNVMGQRTPSPPPPPAGTRESPEDKLNRLWKEAHGSE